MRGLLFSTDRRLPEEDLVELTDILACQIFQKFGDRSVRLSRRDVSELVATYIEDLDPEDQRAIPWMVWDLLQEGFEEDL